MCVYIYISLYICTLDSLVAYVRTYPHTCIHGSECVFTHMLEYADLQVQVYTSKYMCVYKHVYAHIHVRTCTYVYIYICIPNYISTGTFMHICVCIHTYTCIEIFDWHP